MRGGGEREGDKGEGGEGEGEGEGGYYPIQFRLCQSCPVISVAYSNVLAQ